MKVYCLYRPWGSKVSIFILLKNIKIFKTEKRNVLYWVYQNIYFVSKILLLN